MSCLSWVQSSVLLKCLIYVCNAIDGIWYRLGYKSRGPHGCPDGCFCQPLDQPSLPWFPAYILYHSSQLAPLSMVKAQGWWEFCTEIFRGHEVEEGCLTLEWGTGFNALFPVMVPIWIRDPLAPEFWNLLPTTHGLNPDFPCTEDLCFNKNKNPALKELILPSTLNECMTH